MSNIESALARLSPRPARLDRDRLMFLAGRASVRDAAPARRRVWLWPSAAVVSTTVAAMLAVVLIVREQPREVVRIEYVQRQAPAGPDNARAGDDSPSPSAKRDVANARRVGVAHRNDIGGAGGSGQLYPPAPGTGQHGRAGLFAFTSGFTTRRDLQRRFPALAMDLEALPPVRFTGLVGRIDNPSYSGEVHEPVTYGELRERLRRRAEEGHPFDETSLLDDPDGIQRGDSL